MRAWNAVMLVRAGVVVDATHKCSQVVTQEQSKSAFDALRQMPKSAEREHGWDGAQEREKARCWRGR